GRETFGHSAIVDPWGRVLAERPQGEAVLLAVRDAAEQADIRRRMPVVAHRRFFPPAEPRPARTE
ncbi:carbon-nitrogen hydrolase family protein, partial [Pseudomonas aeruginosa]|nr:carbon-nitrogen hydrolase family protein [Pseudomonas aeruginosa]